METITAYEDLARLVTGHFHRGVRTNTMVSPEEYGPAIAAGTLRAQATPAGLLLCCAAGSKTVKKVLDNLCGWCYSLAVKSIDREKYHPIAAQRAGP